jgi:hypothetical protein
MIIWKVVGQWFIRLLSIIMIPCSWYVICTTVSRTLGELVAIVPFLALVAFSVWYFITWGEDEL